ncbi:MAG: hypothetical protein IPO91_34215 [Chloroflexi bacterium]|nr:hypothetical protein [Chloroflexota bacterium]
MVYGAPTGSRAFRWDTDVLAVPALRALHAPISAQEATPEPTAEVALEATNEVTPEATAALPQRPARLPGPGDYTVSSASTASRTLSVYIPKRILLRRRRCRWSS